MAVHTFGASNPFQVHSWTERLQDTELIDTNTIDSMIIFGTSFVHCHSGGISFQINASFQMMGDLLHSLQNLIGDGKKPEFEKRYFNFTVASQKDIEAHNTEKVLLYEQCALEAMNAKMGSITLWFGGKQEYLTKYADASTIDAMYRHFKQDKWGEL